MKGDFTRKTFDPLRHYSRVMMQQGRVQLDADHNEQAAILLHYLRTLAMDLGGLCWGPIHGGGFELLKDKDNENFSIGYGRYYVDGILCENDSENDSKILNYLSQEGFDLNDPRVKQEIVVSKQGQTYVAYLDVWERHITYLQDDLIRETALGGADSCTRAKVVWQVRLMQNAEDRSEATEKNKLNEEIAHLKEQMATANVETQKKMQAQIDELAKQLEALGTKLAIPTQPSDLKLWLDKHLARNEPKMKAMLASDPDTANPCSISAGARYRGVENQLYRIEVHRAGNAKAATFKWSRDNGSVIFSIVSQKGAVVTLQSLGRDERTGLKADDWVEIMDDNLDLLGIPGIMAQVKIVSTLDMTVTLTNPNGTGDSEFKYWNSYGEKSTCHPFLRRWDHRAAENVTLSEGAVQIKEDDIIEIEDGIEVQFQGNADNPVEYRTGDYWLIPARAATGNIEWPPDDAGKNEFVPRVGIYHHYAPLGIIEADGTIQDCRCLHDQPDCIITTTNAK